MAESNISGLMGTTLEKLKQLIDVDTIIGEPVVTGSGITILPISKVSFGFASGGSDIPTTKPKEVFGGGAGGGVTIQPIGFLVINGDSVRVVQVPVEHNTQDKLVNMIPDLLDRFADFLKKEKEEKKAKDNSEGVDLEPNE